MNKFAYLLAGCVLLLTGCAGVKGDFDCDATTSDRCMTMTQANQLARDKTTGGTTGKPVASALPTLVDIPPASRSTPAPIVSLPQTTMRPPASQPAVSSGVPAFIAHAPATSSSRTPSSFQTTTPCVAARCNEGGMGWPGRTNGTTATVWIAPWVDSSNNFHQPGRVSFEVSSPAWVLPSRID